MTSKKIKKMGTVCAVSFDVHKAFDVVPTAKLIECLRTEYGVPSCLLSWLSSYFHNRTQAVKVDNCYSNWRPVKAGVVQGSVIGPLLFIAYFDKVYADQDGNSVSVKYADDLVLFHPANTSDDICDLQGKIDGLVEAMHTRGLTVNASKTCCMLISESTAPYQMTQDLTIENESIEMADSLTYLGVILDPKLNWSANNRGKITKAKQAIGSLRRKLKNKISRTILHRLLVSKVLPIFMYGLLATYPLYQGDRLSLERLNRYVVRLSCNDYRSSYLDILARLNMQPVYMQILHRRLLLGQSYFCGSRYQPIGVLCSALNNPRARRRLHDRALAVSEPTGVRYTNSSLESILRVWNRIPNNLATLANNRLKQQLRTTNYTDNIWEIATSMRAAIMVL